MLEKVIDYLSEPAFVAAITPIVSGGVAGALISIYHAKKVSRTNLALNVLKEYLEKYYENQGNCKWILMHPNDPRSNTEESLNILRQFLDWGDLVAILYLNNYLDKTILRQVGLVNQLLDIYKDTKNSAVGAKVHFENHKNLKRLEKNTND